MTNKPLEDLVKMGLQTSIALAVAVCKHWTCQTGMMSYLHTRSDVTHALLPIVDEAVGTYGQKLQGIGWVGVFQTVLFLSKLTNRKIHSLD